MNHFIPKLKRKYEEFLDVLTKFIEFEDELREEIKKAHAEERGEDLADIGYFLRSSEKVLEELRKSVSAKLQLNTNRIAHLVATKSMEDPEHSGNFRGAFCLATPDIKSGIKIPPKGSEQYKELCEAIGVDDEIIERGIVNFSFRALGDYIDECRANDEELVPGLELKYDRPVCTYRKNSKAN